MSGDEERFKDFVLHRWPVLVRYAYLLTGDPGQAEDLVQTSLERCWRAWRRVEADNPEAYVRTAIARGAVSRFRMLGRRVAEAPLETAERRAVTPDDAQARADHDVVWAELAALPPRMRAVVVLRVYEDLSVDETATLLGCSKGTVKSTLSRALDRLSTSPALRDLVGAPDAEVTR